ncbi:hypothetical protein LL06_13745 [Hoeflea sp. BAL378]|uniref:ABC transporter permease n=1 Tax=Hoeflea sp. BAL378 TaxID=1547437 RepID=UPI0005135BC2|nr:ABC transporter permease [Hoeflea sp. BAL378]KGF68927.1 hypothetical protein LL06_13745 [Hoeflea sp. BAL378]
MLSLAYLARRLFAAAVTILVAVSLNFVLFRVLPGNAVTHIARIPNASVEMRRALEAKFGLDKPIWEQFLIYLREMAHGNLGISYANRQPVLDNLLEAFANTIPMVATGVVLALGLGLVVGTIAASRRNGPADHLLTGSAVLAYAFPTQFLGLMMVILFSGLLPAAGMADPFLISDSWWEVAQDRILHMILPVTTLVLTLYAENALITRSSMLETLGEDYILTARAKGVPRRRIILRHALRNALLPIVTMSALSLGSIVSGAILVEVIFSWPGIGRTLYEAVLNRDYPMLQGGFLAITVVVTMLNLTADLLHFVLDPRVRA